MTVRILIADDHKILREGLRSLLEKQSAFAVVAEAEDGLTAYEGVKRHKPDIAILDIGMGASGLGLLYAAPSAGSLLGSAALLVAGDIKHKGIVVVLAAIGFAGSLALLGVSKWFVMALVAVILLGITDSVSVAIRRTVVQLLAPNEMLGRANSLVVIFAQTTNGLGALLAGASAQFMGAPNSLLVGSGLCFLMILATCIAIPQLWRYRSD